MNSDEFENNEKTSQFIKKGLLKGGLPASFNQRLMEKIRREKAPKPGFNFFGFRPAYALATLLIILSLTFFFAAQHKNKTTIAVIPEQTAVSFTHEDHHEAEDILLVSNNMGEDEVLVDLFANNGGF